MRRYVASHGCVSRNNAAEMPLNSHDLLSVIAATISQQFREKLKKSQDTQP